MPDYAAAILLALLGFVFLTAEVFIPSFGVLFSLSVVSFITGIIFAFREAEYVGYIFIFVLIIAIPLLIIKLLKVLPETKFGRLIFLRAPERQLAEAVEPEELDRYLGRRGTAKSLLRPAGVAEFDGERVDVVTEGLIIEPGAPVEVMHVEGNRLVVKPIKEKEEKKDNV
jgi:membrane-bound serine protease (ClpP class)